VSAWWCSAYVGAPDRRRGYPAGVTREDYHHLPQAIRLEDTIAEVDTRPVPDPDGGVDPETIFLLGFAAV
jgi:hypothetical protein